MLILTRKVGEAIILDDDIEITLMDIQGNHAKIGIDAPGSDIWSTYKNGGYAELSGTSMATPFVAGLAALIASKHKSSRSNDTPLENNEDMKNHLLRMATHPGYHDNQSGYGPLRPFGYFGGL